MKRIENSLRLGVELEVEIRNDPEPKAIHTSEYVIYGSYPKHHNLGHSHKKHGNIIAAADELVGDTIETHYDNTINDGVEWIGKPLTLKQNKEIWNELLEDERISPYIHGEDVHETKGNGYGTHDVGMHVHVSGSPISPVVMGKLLVFVNATINKSFIEFIAGRKLNRFCETKVRNVEDGNILYHSDDCTRPSKRGKKITSNAHGQVDVYDSLGVPCCNNALRFSRAGFQRGAIWVAPAYGTGDFEIRIFKSTVNPQRFNANLEFVVAIVEYCSLASVGELNYKGFCEWMSKLEQRLHYTSLFKFMRKNGYTEGIVPKQETIDEWIKSGKIKGVAA